LYKLYFVRAKQNLYTDIKRAVRHSATLYTIYTAYKRLYVSVKSGLGRVLPDTPS